MNLALAILLAVFEPIIVFQIPGCVARTQNGGWDNVSCLDRCIQIVVRERQKWQIFYGVTDRSRMPVITKSFSIIFIHTGKLHLNASLNAILELSNSTKAVTQLIIKHPTCDKTRKFIIAQIISVNLY